MGAGTDHIRCGWLVRGRSLKPQQIHAFPAAVELNRAEPPAGYVAHRYRLPPCTDLKHRGKSSHAAMLDLEALD